MPVSKTIVLLAFENRDLESYPPIINSSQILSSKGYKVKIVVPPLMKTRFNLDGVEVLYCQRDTFASYINFAAQVISVSDIFFVISFYYEGLAALTRLRDKKRKIAHVYISLELIYQKAYSLRLRRIVSLRLWCYKVLKLIKSSVTYRADSQSSVDFFLEDLEWLYTWKIYHKKYKGYALCMVAQDSHRLEELRKEMNWHRQTFILPNSFIGHDRLSSTFVTEKYSLPPRQKILLYIGGVERGFDTGMFDMVSRLPADYTLFVNCFSRDGFILEVQSDYSALIAESRIIINMDILSNDDLHDLVKSSFICLAWYSPAERSNTNMFYLGLSSGKLCKYLQCGKPVIAPDHIYGYKQLLENNHLGVTVKDASQIPDQVLCLESSYDLYSEQIIDFYCKSLDFTMFFTPIIDFVESSVPTVN